MQTHTQNNTSVQSTSHSTHNETFSMSSKGQALAKAHINQKGLLIALSNNECFADAIMLLSYAMPHQKGIRWALNCVSNNDSTSGNASSNIDATEKWLNEPSEINRMQILPTGTVSRPSSTTWLAMAAYWSGGYIANSDTALIEAAPDRLVNDSIYSAVMLSVQETEENTHNAAYSKAIKEGIEFLFS